MLHVIATNFYGGPEKQIVKHCSLMDSHRWRMMVCSFLEGKSRNEFLDRSAELGIETNMIHTASVYNPLVLYELASLVKKKKPDIVVAHGYRSLILCLFIKFRIKSPIIAFSRGLTSENLKIRLFERLYLKLMNFSDLILAVSNGHKLDLINQGVKEDKIRVIHNAVSIEEATPDSDSDLRRSIFRRLDIPDGVLVVTAGRLSPEKGHRFLLEAISNLGEKVNRTYFVFCGEGICKKDLEDQAKKLNIENHCRFVGFRRDLDEIFQVMDFMVLPSLTEGLPNVVLEAFANKKPVVATSVGGVPEVVEDGINGILVPSSRPVLLSKGIERLISSQKLREKMGEAGYKKVKEYFSFESQNKKLEEIYQLVLG